MSSRGPHVASPGRQVRIAASSAGSARSGAFLKSYGPRAGSADGPGNRLLDIVVGGTALVLCAPLMAVIAALVAGTSRGGPVFRQVRVGRDEKTFVMYKFRTMHVRCDDRAHREFVRRLLLGTPPPVGAGGLYKLVDDPRVTRVGRLLRRFSLDELPQLINVLRGDMALVGPRPVLPWEAALFAPEYRARFLVRPGVTGLWQVSGRSRLSMTEALRLDVDYVEKRSLTLDLKILLRTLPVVLVRQEAR